jgi:hypothetical protein
VARRNDQEWRKADGQQRAPAPLSAELDTQVGNDLQTRSGHWSKPPDKVVENKSLFASFSSEKEESFLTF